MRRPVGSVVVAVSGLAIVLALTGCGRFGNGTGPAAPGPATTSANTIDDVLSELDGADDALTQVESDVEVGDTASGTTDAP